MLRSGLRDHLVRGGAAMIHDSLDIMNPRVRFTAQATYYPHESVDPADGGTPINYESVDVFSRTYRRLFGNIQSFQAGETSIRTADLLDYKVGGIIRTQDGQTFSILQVSRDYQAAPKQAFRIQGLPIGVQVVMRLVTIDDPWRSQ